MPLLPPRENVDKKTCLACRTCEITVLMYITKGVYLCTVEHLIVVVYTIIIVCTSEGGFQKQSTFSVLPPLVLFLQVCLEQCTVKTANTWYVYDQVLALIQLSLLQEIFNPVNLVIILKTKMYLVSTMCKYKKMKCRAHWFLPMWSVTGTEEGKPGAPVGSVQRSS